MAPEVERAVLTGCDRGEDMTITVEELYEQAQGLTPEERQRLALLLVSPLIPVTPEPTLGERLRAIRARIVASGEPLLDEAALEAEIADRRGER
jgi:hypothetical protein